jgi:hypothetical protein
MALSISKVGKVIIIEGTEGGDTYEVRMRGELDKKKLCYRKVRKQTDKFGLEMRCEQPSGFGTDHVGTGACKFHSSNGVAITHGRSAVQTRSQLAARIDKYKIQDQADLLDLSTELSTMKAIFEEFIEGFAKPKDTNYGVHLERATKMISTIMRLVDNISKIESRNAITASQVIYLRAVVSDILMKYIIDPVDQKRAAQELVQRVGGTTEYPVIEA